MNMRSDSNLSELIDAKSHTAASKWRLLRFAFLVLIVVVGFSSRVLAQQATLVGTVTDPSGASPPNVNITATNAESGVIRSTSPRGSKLYF
jgi:hypothetical protein